MFDRRICLAHWFSTGGPQMFAYFDNGFASQMRLSNSGRYEPVYGPTPMNWRRIDFIFFCKSTPIPTADFFLEITSAAMRSDNNPSNFVIIRSPT